jgi:hypothetical protein
MAGHSPKKKTRKVKKMENQTESKNLPVASWTAKRLQVSVWERKMEKGNFYDVKICRSYHDEKKNEWRETDSFDYADLPLLIELIGNAFTVAMKADIGAREGRRQVAARYP